MEEPFIPAKKAHPAFEIQNLDGLKMRLMQKEIQFNEDDNLPGANRIHLFDPFGNRMEFLEWK